MASEANERLRDAAMDGDAAGIAAALLAGADPSVALGDWTPLRWAAASGHVAVIAALLAAGARVDGADSSGSTPLIVASVGGHPAAIDALLAAGADVHRPNNSGYTALHLACTRGKLDAAHVLLEAGARTDVRNRDGMYSQRPLDEVRAPAHSFARLLRLRDRDTSLRRPRCLTQVCKWTSEKSNKPALTALLASAAPWSRRRPVALACYADVWEWEA
jgi:ankyrin repeat protein